MTKDNLERKVGQGATKTAALKDLRGLMPHGLKKRSYAVLEYDVGVVEGVYFAVAKYELKNETEADKASRPGSGSPLPTGAGTWFTRY